MMDMPPAILDLHQQEACIERAAAHYGAHPDIIRAVMRTEGGKTGNISYNKDGSFDIGKMQVNSVHLPELANYGITSAMLTNDECLNIHIGTYYLQKNVITAPHFWNGVGRYHSKTPVKNINYQYRVWGNLEKLRNERGYR